MRRGANRASRPQEFVRQNPRTGFIVELIMAGLSNLVP